MVPSVQMPIPFDRWWCDQDYFAQHEVYTPTARSSRGALKLG
jgi:hypothetical protein